MTKNGTGQSTLQVDFPIPHRSFSDLFHMRFHSKCSEYSYGVVPSFDMMRWCWCNDFSLMNTPLYWHPWKYIRPFIRYFLMVNPILITTKQITVEYRKIGNFSRWVWRPHDTSFRELLVRDQWSLVDARGLCGSRKNEETKSCFVCSFLLTGTFEKRNKRTILEWKSCTEVTNK